MLKQGKLYSKKEKTAGILVSTALLGAPFLFEGTNVAYATFETLPPPVIAVDKIGNLIVPLNRTIPIRDLKSIYEADNTNFSVTSTNSEIVPGTEKVADNEPGYSSVGLLKIHPNREGTATFTVSFCKNNMQFEDTFEVTVVSDTNETAERNFDINDVAKRISIDPEVSKEEVEKLLHGIGRIDFTGNEPGNHSPSLDANNPFFSRGMPSFNTYSPLGTNDLSSFFLDSDGDEVEVEFISNSANPVAEVINYGNDGWVIHSLHAGTGSLTAIARDGHGGVVASAPFTITVANLPTPPENVAPEYNSESHPSELAEFLAGSGHILNVSPNSELDLNELFYDTTDESLNYEVDVKYEVNLPESEPQQVTTHFSLPSSLITLDNIENLILNADERELAGSVSISKLKATDKGGLSTYQNVDIQLNDYNQFEAIPDEIELYPSNIAGVSKLTVDTKMQNWIYNGQSILNVSTQNQSSSSSYVQRTPESDDITFFAGTNENESKRVKIYSALNETSPIVVWYQNDIIIKTIGRPNTSTIDLTKLLGFQNENEEYWSIFSANFNEYVTYPTSVAEVTYYYSGSYIVSAYNYNPNSTANGITLTIDPNGGQEESGSFVYTVPFIKPE